MRVGVIVQEMVDTDVLRFRLQKFISFCTKAGVLWTGWQCGARPMLLLGSVKAVELRYLLGMPLRGLGQRACLLTSGPGIAELLPPACSSPSRPAENYFSDGHSVKCTGRCLKAHPPRKITALLRLFWSFGGIAYDSGMIV